ncbi:MAG: phosphoribosylformimino-5-aminoimidazole carboxamide ribotide isomerase [Agathobacter sp.]|nr:phosphoribosylformimino-5-aminoimidazole carboxamide ribotide isomerase [Agathobacter sp.]
MQFRPCIDIHNGKVKQIVGSSLKDIGNQAEENFVSEQDAAFYANMYKEDGVVGGHIILLNAADSEYYDATRQQALNALRAYPKGLQIGGGITAENAPYYIEAGASHVIVTSYVFKDGKINYANLQKLVASVGKERLVLDLSCRYLDGKTVLDEESVAREAGYYVVTDRWQKFTAEKVSLELLDELSQYCDEFLIHAVDVEGKQNGIERALVELLGRWGKCPMTYAGGVRSFEDLKQLDELGHHKLNVTIGSALDLFGGTLKYRDVLDYIRG